MYNTDHVNNPFNNNQFNYGNNTQRPNNITQIINPPHIFPDKGQINQANMIFNRMTQYAQPNNNPYIPNNVHMYNFPGEFSLGNDGPFTKSNYVNRDNSLTVGNVGGPININYIQKPNYFNGENKYFYTEPPIHMMQDLSLNNSNFCNNNQNIQQNPNQNILNTISQNQPTTIPYTTTNSNLNNISTISHQNITTHSNKEKNNNITKTVQNYTEMNDEELVRHAYVLAKDQGGCRFLQKKSEESLEFTNNLLFPNVI